MKKKNVFLVLLLAVSVLLNAACSISGGGDVTLGGESTTVPVQITVDFDLNIDVEEGKDADGFTWENNFSEITITGYIGASNELTVPKTINGKPVTKIADGALEGFTGLKSIVIPGSVKSIVGVFKDCTGLETVVIADAGLEDMTKAFENCTSLKTVNVPSTVTQMEGAFRGCSALTSDITVPEGVTSLKNTFRDCSALKKVTIAESVTDLDNAFNGCAGLTQIAVPAGVTSMDSAFANCSSLKQVQLSCQVSSLYYTFAYCTALEGIEIPATVASLYGTFVGCTSLVDVTIPENVTNLNETFDGCAALRQIVIPGSVTEMYKAFINCVSLTEVTFADLSHSVNNTYGAFNGCTSLKKLDLPLDCEFSGYGCIALEELTIRTTEIEYWVQSICFGNLPGLLKVTILSDAEEFNLQTYTEFESSYTEFKDTATSWYESMYNEAYRAVTNKHGYRYYEETLDDGTACRRLIGIYDSSSWSAEPVPVEVKESRAQVGNQIIYTCYGPALFGDDLTPGVLLYKTVETAFLECYRPEADDAVCGTDFYAECGYRGAVEINGISYPLELFDNPIEG